MVFAKLGAPRPRTPAAARPPAAGPARPPGRAGGLVLGTALAAVAACGLYVWLRPVRPEPGIPAAARSAETPGAVPDDAEAPAPPPTLSAAAATPAEPIALPPDAVSAADRGQAEALIRRLTASLDFTLRDVEAAEGLFARHPQEAAVQRLLEQVLIATATREMRSQRLPAALALFRRATEVQPASLSAWVGLSMALLEQGDWSGSEAAARQALSITPRSFDALQALGYALMRQDRNREAEEALLSALQVRNDGGTRALLARLRKGLEDERGMAEQKLSHFHVRYDGDAHEGVGREILAALERHFATLAVSLDHQPQVTIPVILFTRQGYYDASGAPAWSGGVFDGLDGRIRVPVGGLDERLTPDMDSTLLHELTHAFVNDRTRGVAPRDIHEGLAQYMEGKRVGSMLTQEQLTALADGRVGGVAGFYLGALSYVEYLIAQRGMGGINDLLRAMGETGNVDQAFTQVHGQTQMASRRAWAQRLRMTEGS
ncbi:MAG: tetratricopeptide repeat protein [Vicinamibacteria bacterium]